ncbi:immunoglobulin kappa light chain-like [Cyclopterus lumpus]|uniref:immunoglobulin kappa light chain-like n=1 Tax=Cyclopterus lumpus TaxID=8103 RepID=UPI0014860912|nr:immunoglobulin kappa light chain-like [Cyclopterus lumpus]
MTSLNFVSYLTFLCLWSIAPTTTDNLSVRQESGFVSARVGDSVTLRCFYEGDISALFFWYKQTLGMKPRLISTLFKYVYISFSDEFQNNPNVTLETNNKSNHLTISNLRILDSATYFCVSHYKYKTIFCEGTTVSVKGSGLNVPVLVHQSASETIQPGGSVTLNCTVHTGTCDGQHSVYWFKDSEESHPGLIYTHGGRNDQCERKPITQTHTCSYNLPMKSLNLSDAGTYYCAVASCGRVLFGDRTDLVDKVDSRVYFLSAALAFTTILVVLLAFSVYKMRKRNSCQCTESQRVSASTATNVEGYRDADNLHYTAVRYYRANGSRRQRDNIEDQCVYSSVKQ